jgi:hypothetical protein
MKAECPKCGNQFDVSVKAVLSWIERTPVLRDAAASLIGRINGQKVDPAKQSRGSEGGKKAAKARWAGHVPKKAGKGEKAKQP